MADFATTKLTSKGQVVIPETIREKLKLNTGSRFIVFGENDVIILKRVTSPSSDEVNRLLEQAREVAKQIGLKPQDLEEIIEQVRTQK